MLFTSFALAAMFSTIKANRHWLYLKHTEPEYSNYKDINEWKNKNFGKIEAFGNLIMMLIPILIKSPLEKENESIKNLGKKVRIMIRFQYASVLMFILSFFSMFIFSA